MIESLKLSEAAGAMQVAEKFIREQINSGKLAVNELGQIDGQSLLTLFEAREREMASRVDPGWYSSVAYDAEQSAAVVKMALEISKQDAQQPSQLTPGSLGKQALLRARAHHRLPLHLPGDRWACSSRNEIGEKGRKL